MTYEQSGGQSNGNSVKYTSTLISQNPVLSIITPTYNEAENIREFIERVVVAMKEVSYELIVVDDNSPDGTADIAEQLSSKYGNIKVLKRPNKLGLASAVRDGFNKTKADIIAIMDADLQHPPELLPKMLDEIKSGCEIVVASRYVEGGSVEGWSVLRKIMSKGAIFLAHLLYPRTRAVRDPISGFFYSEGM